MRYPRDMHGYGGRPPAADWPGGAKVAVQFVLNYEEGGENCDPARRRRLRGVPLRDRRRRPLAGPAPLEHGIDLRVRRPRRLLAAARPLHLPRRAGHRLRRRHRARPLARPGRGDAGRRLGDRQPRPEVDRLPRPHPRGRGAPTSPRRSACTPRSPASPRAAGTPAAARSTPSISSPRRAASTGSPTPTTTTCPTGASTPAASSSSSPTPSTPTTCASPRPRASTPATSSSPTSRTASTPSTPRARPAARR